MMENDGFKNLNNTFVSGDICEMLRKIPDSFEKNVGVIVGRFQNFQITQAHKDLISVVSNDNAKVIILIGVSPLKNSRRNPLDYSARHQMINSWISEKGWSNEFVFAPIFDHEHDHVWCRRLDEIVSNLTNCSNQVTLYGGRDSFISAYKGAFKTCRLPSMGDYSSTKERIKCIRVKNDPMFRMGVINASYSRYPTCYQVVDIALYNDSTNEIALIKKDGDSKFRFPGGFSDPNSTSLEVDVKRELSEELGINVNADEPKYIGSTLIDDWRYRGDTDKIKSALFATKWLWGTIKAGDDAYSCEWIPVSQLKESIMDNHKHLADMFLQWYESKNMPLYHK